MAALRNNLKASTLVESLVAMVVLMICIAIASTVIVNIMQSRNARTKIKAEQILNEVARKTKIDKSFVDEDLTVNGILVHKTVEKYEQSESCLVISLKATGDKGETLAEYKEIDAKE